MGNFASKFLFVCDLWYRFLQSISGLSFLKLIFLEHRISRSHPLTTTIWFVGDTRDEIFECICSLRYFSLYSLLRWTWIGQLIKQEIGIVMWGQANGWNQIELLAWRPRPQHMAHDWTTMTIWHFKLSLGLYQEAAFSLKIWSQRSVKTAVHGCGNTSYHTHTEPGKADINSRSKHVYNLVERRSGQST